MEEKLKGMNTAVRAIKMAVIAITTAAAAAAVSVFKVCLQKFFILVVFTA